MSEGRKERIWVFADVRIAQLLKRVSAVSRVPKSAVLREWILEGFEQSFGMSLEEAERATDEVLHQTWLDFMKIKKEFPTRSTGNFRGEKP